MFSLMTRQPRPEPFDLWLTSSVCIVCLERDTSASACKAWLDAPNRRILYQRGTEFLAFEGLPCEALNLARSGYAGIVEFGSNGPMHEQVVLPNL